MQKTCHPKNLKQSLTLPIKCSVRQIQMEIVLKAQEKEVSNAIEVEALEYIRKMILFLKTASNSLEQINLACKNECEPNQLEFEVIYETLSLLKGWNKKDEANSFLKSGKIFNTYVHQELTSLLNLLALIESIGCGEVEEKIFNKCILVIDYYLVTKKFIFNADELENLRSLLASVGHRELSHLLRVLALLVIEVNDKNLFKGLMPQSGMGYSINHIVMNHLSLVSEPSFLQKMVEIGMCLIEVMSNLMECKNEIQLKETIDSLSKNGTLYRSGLCVKEMMIYLESQFSSRYRNLLNKKFMIEYCLKNSSFMELLFILQNLLTGRKKIVVQDALLKMKLIENFLERLFDIFFHREFNISDEDDEDSKDICFSARIQLLRLIINFNDRDDQNSKLKAGFISPSEHSFLQNYSIPLFLHLHSNSAAQPYQPVSQIKSSLHSFSMSPPQSQPSQNITDISASCSRPPLILQVQKNLNQEPMKCSINGIVFQQKLLNHIEEVNELTQDEYIENMDDPNWKKSFEELIFPSELNKQTVAEYKKDKFEGFIQSKGLMHKIIDALKIVGDNCQLRYWLGSCVESFLRGSHWYLQLFVQETGLPYFLMRQYVLLKLSKQNNIQITLDIFSELVKYNLLSVIYLNIILIEQDWFKKLDKLMFKNIVDTNVFLRNLYLTYEKLQYTKTTNQASMKQYKKSHEYLYYTSHQKNNKLFKELCENNLFRTLSELIASVNTQNLNIDNISCIHSALVILIFYRSYHTLDTKFQLLASHFGKSDTLLTFQKLLTTWVQYMQLKTREMYCLQFSTGIEFKYFVEVIKLFNSDEKQEQLIKNLQEANQI